MGSPETTANVVFQQTRRSKSTQVRDACPARLWPELCFCAGTEDWETKLDAQRKWVKEPIIFSTEPVVAARWNPLLPRWAVHDTERLFSWCTT